jgi:hypothetical protein
MKKVIISCILGFGFCSSLNASEQPAVSEKQCLAFQKSMVRLIAKGEIFYQKKDKSNFKDNIELQQETIRMYNRNGCYLYTKDPLKMKTTGERTIEQLQEILDGKREGGLL